MPRAQWPLLHDRPIIQVILALVQGGQQVARNLLADTGAGTAQSVFELLRDERDCLLCGGFSLQGVVLGGVYVGSSPVSLVRVRIPLLGSNQSAPVVGLPAGPAGFDGIACFQ